MKTLLKSLFAIVALAGLLSAKQAVAAEASTTLTVEGMHCGGCAKKIAAKLKAIPGVEDVQADVKTSQISVSTKANQRASARAMWEAVEKAGYKTVKLVGPSGSFTEKPKS